MAEGIATTTREWDGVRTASAVTAGEISAREVVEAALLRAEAAAAADPTLGAIVTSTPDAALAAASAAPSGPLAGVPTAIKDLDDVAGVMTGLGSAALGGRVPSSTPVHVRQVLSPGLVSIGKSAAPELGLTASTEPVHLPPTRNPWAPDRSPGGSSGGAAALVAAGVVPIAHATDGGGSIRIPAALCGLVGLKPSRGRFLPLPAQQPLPVQLAVSGVVTTTVRDTAVWAAAAERFAGSPAGLPPIGQLHAPADRGLRVGLLVDDPDGVPVHRDVVAAVEATATVLEGAGHEIVLIAPPVDGAFADAFVLYWGVLAQASRLLGRDLKGREFRNEDLEPWTRWLQDHVKRNLVRLPGALRYLRRDVPRAWTELLGRVDVVLSPVTGTPAPPIGHLATDIPGEVHHERVRQLANFTPIQNVVGAPGISLPLGRSGGLPVGVQLSGAVGDERTLIELAMQLEQAMPWPRHAPTWWGRA